MSNADFGDRLSQIIAAYLEEDATLCPRCAVDYLTPGKVSADRFGVCETCHKMALAAATEQRMREEVARREYDKMRKRKSRACPGRKKRSKPLFK